MRSSPCRKPSLREGGGRVTVVRVPASTANLGPGFDALGMALDIHAEVGVLEGPTEPADRADAVGATHPAAVAYRAAGGVGELWVRSPIPIGRGLGFSGAMRVAGATAALARRDGDVGDDRDWRAEVLAVAAELECHADNAAASLYGGVVATDGVRAVAVAVAFDPDVVLWIPEATTSTSASRTSLPSEVTFADAVFNVGRTAVLIGALGSGDVGLLAAATEDRLHQDRRFAMAEGSRAALAAGLAAGAWCGWLSGSGPTVALLADSGSGGNIAAALPPGAARRVVGIDREGTVVTP